MPVGCAADFACVICGEVAIVHGNGSLTPRCMQPKNKLHGADRPGAGGDTDNAPNKTQSRVVTKVKYDAPRTKGSTSMSRVHAGAAPVQPSNAGNAAKKAGQLLVTPATVAVVAAHVSTRSSSDAVPTRFLPPPTRDGVFLEHLLYTRRADASMLLRLVDDGAGKSPNPSLLSHFSRIGANTHAKLLKHLYFTLKGATSGLAVMVTAVEARACLGLLPGASAKARAYNAEVQSGRHAKVQSVGPAGLTPPEAVSDRWSLPPWPVGYITVDHVDIVGSPTTKVDKNKWITMKDPISNNLLEQPGATRMTQTDKLPNKISTVLTKNTKNQDLLELPGATRTMQTGNLPRCFSPAVSARIATSVARLDHSIPSPFYAMTVVSRPTTAEMAVDMVMKGLADLVQGEELSTLHRVFNLVVMGLDVRSGPNSDVLMGPRLMDTAGSSDLEAVYGMKTGAFLAYHQLIEHEQVCGCNDLTKCAGIGMLKRIAEALRFDARSKNGTAAIVSAVEIPADALKQVKRHQGFLSSPGVRFCCPDDHDHRRLMLGPLWYGKESHQDMTLTMEPLLQRSDAESEDVCPDQSPVRQAEAHIEADFWSLIDWTKACSADAYVVNNNFSEGAQIPSPVPPQTVIVRVPLAPVLVGMDPEIQGMSNGVRKAQSEANERARSSFTLEAAQEKRASLGQPHSDAEGAPNADPHARAFAPAEVYLRTVAGAADKLLACLDEAYMGLTGARINDDQGRATPLTLRAKDALSHRGALLRATVADLAPPRKKPFGFGMLSPALKEGPPASNCSWRKDSNKMKVVANALALPASSGFAFERRLARLAVLVDAFSREALDERDALRRAFGTEEELLGSDTDVGIDMDVLDLARKLDATASACSYRRAAAHAAGPHEEAVRFAGQDSYTLLHVLKERIPALDASRSGSNRSDLANFIGSRLEVQGARRIEDALAGRLLPQSTACSTAHVLSCGPAMAMDRASQTTMINYPFMTYAIDCTKEEAVRHAQESKLLLIDHRALADQLMTEITELNSSWGFPRSLNLNLGKSAGSAGSMTVTGRGWVTLIRLHLSLRVHALGPWALEMVESSAMLEEAARQNGSPVVGPTEVLPGFPLGPPPNPLSAPAPIIPACPAHKAMPRIHDPLAQLVQRCIETWMRRCMPVLITASTTPIAGGQSMGQQLHGALTDSACVNLITESCRKSNFEVGQLIEMTQKMHDSPVDKYEALALTFLQWFTRLSVHTTPTYDRREVIHPEHGWSTTIYSMGGSTSVGNQLAHQFNTHIGEPTLARVAAGSPTPTPPRIVPKSVYTSHSRPIGRSKGSVSTHAGSGGPSGGSPCASIPAPGLFRHVPDADEQSFSARLPDRDRSVDHDPAEVMSAAGSEIPLDANDCRGGQEGHGVRVVGMLLLPDNRVEKKGGEEPHLTSALPHLCCDRSQPPSHPLDHGHGCKSAQAAPVRPQFLSIGGGSPPFLDEQGGRGSDSRSCHSFTDHEDDVNADRPSFLTIACAVLGGENSSHGTGEEGEDSVYGMPPADIVAEITPPATPGRRTGTGTADVWPHIHSNQQFFTGNFGSGDTADPFALETFFAGRLPVPVSRPGTDLGAETRHLSMPSRLCAALDAVMEAETACIREAAKGRGHAGDRALYDLPMIVPALQGAPEASKHVWHAANKLSVPGSLTEALSALMQPALDTVREKLRAVRHCCSPVDDTFASLQAALDAGLESITRTVSHYTAAASCSDAVTLARSDAEVQHAWACLNDAKAILKAEIEAVRLALACSSSNHSLNALMRVVQPAFRIVLGADSALGEQVGVYSLCTAELQEEGAAQDDTSDSDSLTHDSYYEESDFLTLTPESTFALPLKTRGAAPVETGSGGGRERARTYLRTELDHGGSSHPVRFGATASDLCSSSTGGGSESSGRTTCSEKEREVEQALNSATQTFARVVHEGRADRSPRSSGSVSELAQIVLAAKAKPLPASLDMSRSDHSSCAAKSRSSSSESVQHNPPVKRSPTNVQQQMPIGKEKVDPFACPDAVSDGSSSHALRALLERVNVHDLVYSTKGSMGGGVLKVAPFTYVSASMWPRVCNGDYAAFKDSDIRSVFEMHADTQSSRHASAIVGAHNLSGRHVANTGKSHMDKGLGGFSVRQATDSELSTMKMGASACKGSLPMD